MPSASTRSGPIRLVSMGTIDLTGVDPPAAARILAQPKRLALLAFLAARPPGERVSRDTVLVTFWPEEATGRARAALRNAIYFLRRAMGPDSIVGGGGAVWTSPERVSCDAADLLAASQPSRALLDLYRGEFLEGLHISGSPDFERWVDGVRAALRRRATDLAWRESELAEAASAWITAAEYARKAVDLSVDVEGASQRLIRLLDRAGDRAAALAEYARLGTLLEKEFGVSPSPETTALIERVRRRAVQWSDPQRSDPQETPVEPSSAPSLAVLPFEDLSGNASALAAGLADDLLTALSTLRGVRLVSRTSIHRLTSDRSLTMPRIHDLLGVDLVLEGSVQAGDGRVRVTAQLIDAARDAHVWAQTYDQPLTHVFEVQSDVALRVARALDVELSPHQHRRLRNRPTANVEAYQLYLKGREIWSHRGLDHAHRAAELFRRALSADPDFAMAWVGLADAYFLSWFMTPATSGPSPGQAKSAIERALEIDPESGEARATLGLILIFAECNHRDAEIQLRRAVELSPGYATGHQWRGQLLTARGRADQGLAELDVALELDFLSPAVNEGMGLALYHAGRIEDAIGRLERTRELDPGYWRAPFGLSLCHATRGRIRQAAQAMLRAWGAGAGGGTTREARSAAAKLDRGPAAVFEGLLAMARARPLDAPVMRMIEVELLMLLGRHRDAMDALEAARDEGNLGCMVQYAPALDPLACEPRFLGLMEDSGLMLPRWSGRS